MPPLGNFVTWLGNFLENMGGQILGYNTLEWKTSKDHPIDNILGDISKGVTTRSKISKFCYHFSFISQIDPKNSKDALDAEHWFLAMQVELN